MNGSDSQPDGSHPLSGVLDRLLARERGAHPPPLHRSSVAAPIAEESLATGPSLEPVDRRMLVIAGLGSDEGYAARCSLTHWGLRAGRLPAALDIGFPVGPRRDAEIAEGTNIPWAGLPCAPERLKQEAPEAQSAVLANLRRHEASADLLLVRVSARCPKTLMRAAFLAGGLVVPVEDTYDEIYKAYQISRELLENFLDLALWPAPRDAGSLERYQAMMRGFAPTVPCPLETGDDQGAESALGRLSEPPEEGFLVSLVDPDAPAPPAPMLQTGTLRV